MTDTAGGSNPPGVGVGGGPVYLLACSRKSAALAKWARRSCVVQSTREQRWLGAFVLCPLFAPVSSGSRIIDLVGRGPYHANSHSRRPVPGATQMSRRWQRPVALVGMVAFLIANTPATAVAVRCPWVLAHCPNGPRLTETTSRPGCPPHDPGCPCNSCCKSGASTTPLTADRSVQPPTCPKTPGCPYGCCWCSVGKVPCCPVIASCAMRVGPCLELLAEAPPLMPPVPCTELIQPPRA